MKLIWFFLITILSFTIQAQEIDREFETWIEKEYQVSITKMFANFNRPDAIKGTIVAAPSYENPNYYYHWVRDASISIGTVFLLLNNEQDEIKINSYKQYISDFIEVTKIHQNQNTWAGLGEVKFLPSGAAYTGPWMRPQNDGPAIRALVLSYYANYLLDHGEKEFVRQNIYGSEWPAVTVTKKDLEYVANDWEKPSYDMWEEVYGDHFFNRLIEDQTLRLGAALAERLNDHGAASWYRLQADRVAATLKNFWNQEKLQLDATIDSLNTNKPSNLDSTVLLAVMAIGSSVPDSFGIVDDRIISTVWKLHENFKNLYSINQRYPEFAPAIGRYREDRYDGYQTNNVGNPWFLTTAAMASYSYRLAWSLKREKVLTLSSLNLDFFKNIARNNSQLLAELSVGKVFALDSWQFEALFKGLFDEGDSYLKRMRFHMDADGSMSEQFNRETGFMQGAPNLTMSYTAFTRAIFSRRNLLPF